MTDTKNRTDEWDYSKLKDRALKNPDRANWDLELYRQDLEVCHKLPNMFDGFPLTKSPFPVAHYDYAVSSVPITIESGGYVLKGVRIGEFENPYSDTVIDKLTLLILTKDKDTENTVLVESRNFPYLTAQGTFYEPDSNFDWIFAASPDGFSMLMVNMKLFDLRFGETVIIYPQADQSFFYDQIEVSPNNYSNFDEFKKELLNQLQVNR